jgi:hypothetical protein
MVRITKQKHEMLRLLNPSTLIQVVFPDLRKCYFTLQNVKLNNSQTEASM